MVSNKQIQLLLSAGVLCSTAVNTAYASESSGLDQIISDQRARQISRQISDNVTRRVTSDIDSSFDGPMAKKAKGASADSNSLLPDSLWSTFSWSRISDDAKDLQAFDVDIYQTTTGVDKRIGDFYFGTTLTYAGTTNDVEDWDNGFFTINGSQGSTHSVGVTPYAAYVINKNFFLSAMSGYTYSNNNSKSSNPIPIPESESDAYQTEVDLNGLHVIDQWFMKGKIGTRYQHTHTKTDPTALSDGTEIAPGSRINGDSWTYIVDTEIGYSFTNGVRPFTGVLYEYNNPSKDTGAADGVFYYSAGVDYSVNQKLNLGAKVQTDLSNKDIDLTTVALTARLALD